MAKVLAGMARKVALGAAGLALAVSLPHAVFAVGNGEAASLLSERVAPFTPAAADPRLAELVAESRTGQAKMLRFTPASTGPARANRSVTVAVRIDPQSAQAISGRSAIDAPRDGSSGALRIAPTRYNLGLARGYASFAQAQAPALSGALSRAQIPDLSEFKPSEGVAPRPSRFAARIEIDEEERVSRSAEAVERTGDQMLDVAGSYRLTRNLDVTAGVRYQQDRDLLPLPDMEQQDSQAVYVGTQFRF